MIGVGQLRWECYRRHQQNPKPCPDSVVLAGEEKTRSTLSHGRGVSYGKIGLTTVAVTHDLLSGMPLVLSEKDASAFGTRTTQCQLSKLIRPTACKKTKHTELIRLLNQDNPVPNCPNSYASLHARRPSAQ